MNDEPGGLHKVAQTLSENQINIEDAYGFVIKSGEQAVLIIQVENQPQAHNILERNGFQLLTDEEIYQLWKIQLIIVNRKTHYNDYEGARPLITPKKIKT